MISDTWTCHICKRERPDAAISVRRHVTVTNGIEMTQNVRYCNDDPDCIKGAETFRFIKSDTNRGA